MQDLSKSINNTQKKHKKHEYYTFVFKLFLISPHSSHSLLSCNSSDILLLILVLFFQIKTVAKTLLIFALKYQRFPLMRLFVAC